MSRWYVFHVRTGQENKIKKLIEVRCGAPNETILQVIVPEEDVIDLAKGEKKVRKRKFLPGYILVETAGEIDEHTWHLLQTTPGVFKVLGAGIKPAPLEQREISQLLQELEDRKSKPVPKVEFNRGDKIEVKNGPFINFEGIVEEVNNERERLRVSVSIFGRSTILELDFWQVEKV
jgi:transcriptional antiterminator NusG